MSVHMKIWVKNFQKMKDRTCPQVFSSFSITMLPEISKLFVLPSCSVQIPFQEG